MLSYEKKLERNLKLFYPFLLSQRRVFYALISIFFLTLPGTSEKIHMLGWFMSAGALASFFLEIPSGYLSDKFGHKRMLVVAKIAMILSTLMYIFATSWIFFLIGSVFISIGFSLQSGTIQAIQHNSLTGLNREEDYIKYNSKLSANISIVSALLLLLVPFSLEIDILAPFYIGLALDLIGLISVILITQPKDVVEKVSTKKVPEKNIMEIIRETKGTGFLSFSLFTAIFSSLAIATGPFREIYLIELGLLATYVGFLSALSRFFWFLIGHNVHKISENFSIKQILIFKSIFTFITFVIVGLSKNPYIVLFLIALHLGFGQATGSIMSNFSLQNHVSDKRYKATILLIKSQIKAIFQVVLPFCFAYIMSISISLGFISAGFFALIYYLVLWPFVNKGLKNTI